MPILVTGAAGFIGSTLVDRLLEDGLDVVGLDSFEPFYPRAVKERNFAHARASSHFRFVELDTRDLDGVMRLIAEVRPRVVVDFAARGGVRDSVTDPWLYIDINVRGVQNLLSASALVGATFIYASSSSVYGAVARAPFREDEMACRPSSPYGATKIAAEALIHAHHETTGLPTRVARLFTVYGPRQRPDLAVHKFAVRMMRREPIPLYARGAATRDYTFVGDVVDGFRRLIHSPESSLVVNLGSHHPYSNLELVRALERVLDVKAEIDMLPPQPGDVPATFADIDRARDLLGWEPATEFDEGLARFRDWLRREEAVYAGGVGA